MAASGVLLLSKAAQMMLSKNHQQELLEEVCARNNTHPFLIFHPDNVISPHLTPLSPSQQYTMLLSLPTHTMHLLKDQLLQEMQKGLQNSKSSKPSQLMMLPTFVDTFPTGHESGSFYAIDIGGTNLRIMYVKLSSTTPGGIDEHHIQQWPIPLECFDTDTGALFQWMVDCFVQVLNTYPPPPPPPPSSSSSSSSSLPEIVIGFCFSFALEQTALNNGKLLLWTKNFKGRGLIDQDVVAALIDTFYTRAGLTVTIPAVVNDTVAALIALKYSQPQTQAGIILGTGTNCAYIECINNMTAKLPHDYIPLAAAAAATPSFSSSSPNDNNDNNKNNNNRKNKSSTSSSSFSYMAVNTEWGGFNSSLFPTCEEDIWVDCASANPEWGRYEKLMSGLYVGEITRRIILKLGIFPSSRNNSNSVLNRQDSIDGSVMAAIEQDDDTYGVLFELLGVRCSNSQIDMVKNVCRMVSLRSARLFAVGVAAVVEKCRTRRSDNGDNNNNNNNNNSSSRIVIGVDGSMFFKYPGYEGKVMEALEELGLGEEDVVLEKVEDGPVLGAACVAAAVMRTRTRAEK
jgi:hexokinase